MFDCVPFALMRVKTIFVPSGDQLGWKHEIDFGAEVARLGFWTCACRRLPYRALPGMLGE
jgi:hypothetical protein